MKIADLMTRDPQTIAPDDTLRHAAQLMDELDVGALPVCDGDRLVGVVSLGDLAAKAARDVGDTLDIISQPPQPDR